MKQGHRLEEKNDQVIRGDQFMKPQESFWVWLQPMRDDVTMSRRLPMADAISRIIPEPQVTRVLNDHKMRIATKNSDL